MKITQKYFLFFSMMVLTLSACNIGIKTPTSSDPLSAASTIVAMTLQAQGLPTSQAISAATPFASPVAATATTKPTLTIIKDNSKCRGGPSADNKVITSFNKATILDMVAKDTADGYWLVKDPATANICWIQAQDATAGGSFASLPEVTPQPTLNVSVPSRPGSPASNFYSYSCDATTITVTINWIDKANNESGYHVYRLGNLVADLPANSTTYTETISYTSGLGLSYSVEAYNNSGASALLSTPTFSCQ